MGRLRAALLVLTCAAAVAACGDDGRLSVADYRAQANAACDRYERDVRALPEPGARAAVPAYAERARTRLQRLVDELAALRPPQDLAARHDELVALGRRSATSLEALAAAARAGGRAKLDAALRAGGEIDARSDALAQRLGLDSCADS